MKKNKISLVALKYKILQARNNYQIPFYLAWLVNQLEGNEETHYVRFLMECTTHFMRIKNYYKMFPSQDVEAKKLIQKQLGDMGYTVKDYNS